MDVRLEKARAIVSGVKVRRQGNTWLVPSQSQKGKGYIVTWPEQEEGEKHYRCTCPDYDYRRKDCKHILAVCLVLTKESERIETTAPDGSTTVTTRTRETATLNIQRRTYPQNWPAYNAAQTQEQAQFQTLLHDLCASIPQPEQTGKNSGRKRLPLRDMVFATAFKVYSTFSGRRFMTDLRDAHAKGYLSRLPHYNSLFTYLEMPELTPLLEQLVAASALPLASIETNFAVDSTGFTSCRYTRWFDHKWGDVKEQHEWMKIHAMCGVTTNVVTAVRATSSNGADSPQFIPLVEQTAAHFTLGEVSADKAYSGMKNLAAVVDRGGTPYVPFKSYTTGNMDAPHRRGATRHEATIWRQLFHYYNLERDAFLARYHQRSNVESTFSMMKRKFGDALRSKTATAQCNEALLKVLCHNICCVIQSMHELGISPEFTAARAA
jgi:DDE family transposase/SWIM zinc finger